MGVLAACTPPQNPLANQPLKAEGSADQFFVPKSSPTWLIALLPDGFPASRIRIGNDNCYYFINSGGVMEPFMADPNNMPSLICIQI